MQLLAAVAVALVVGVGAGPAGASSVGTTDRGGIGVRLVDAPVAMKDDPRALLYIVDHLAPGAVIERRIEVSNTTGATAEIALYAAAATIQSATFVGSAGRAVNDLSSWTSVAPGTATLPPDGRLTATVTVAVPIDAAPGEQYGAVWAEVGSSPVDGRSVVQVNRVGLRLYVSVGPGGAPSADFTIDSLTAARSADGRPTVEAAVRNTGGRALDMNGNLRLSDGPGGLSAGPFDVTLGSTLPIGATEPVTIALDPRLPAGPWKADITLTSGMVERTASATLVFPDAGPGPAVAATAPSSRSLLPFAGVAGLGVLLLLLLAFAKTRPRLRRS